MRLIIRGASVLLITVFIVFSTIVVLAEAKTKETKFDLCTTNSVTYDGIRDDIVWDNGMDYVGLGTTQLDDVLQFDCFIADDFYFEKNTVVCDINWIGGYFDGEPAEFDWCISFMNDDGTGEAPDGHPANPTYAGPFCPQWSDITIEELEPGYYLMSFDLPDVTFPANSTFWISIFGFGQYPPYSGWGYHQDPIYLSPSVWGSDYFGYSFWTPGYDVQGFDHDMCFQLTTKTPAICCVPGITHWNEIEPGETLTGNFYVFNCGEENSNLNWQVDSWPTWMGSPLFLPSSGYIPEGEPATNVTFTFTAPNQPGTKFDGFIKVINTYDSSDHCEFRITLTTPRIRLLRNPLQEKIFELLTNEFTLPQKLIQQFGFGL